MKAAFLVPLLWAVACAHPVPSHERARLHRSTQQEATASEDPLNQLGNLLDGGDGRRPPASAERGYNALAGDPRSGNAVGEEWGERGGRDEGGRVGELRHLNQVDHEDTSTRDGNGIGFLEEDARDDGDTRDHHGLGVHGLPSHADGLLDEEDDSGDDTFDANGEEEGGEGPTYAAGADGAGERGGDDGRGDAGAGRGHGDSSSSSSSESTGADHWRYRNYIGSRYERGYGHGVGSSSSQEEEENYGLEDEAMQGDDPSVFDGPGSSYKGFRAGPHALGSSREGGGWAGSYRWQEGDSRSPEVEDTDSGEDSPSVEDNSESEEPVASQSEENSSTEDRDGEDSPSKESEGSKSVEGTAEQSEEELGEDSSQEVMSASSERSGSQSQEGREDRESAEDQSAPLAPDSESQEDEGDQSKSGEDDNDHSQSTEDTAEDSKEGENNSALDEDVPSTSAESQSASPEDAGSQEDTAGEDSSSTESEDSESREDDSDDHEESHSQEDATRESSSHGDDSSPQSLESRSRSRRPGAYHHKPAADYDDTDCQDGY